MIFAHTHTFRKANDTITTTNLGNNTIGDAGAIALAESLKATLVTCVLQVRASLFPSRTHRRRSATCRATVLARCSASFFVLMCLSCVACRGVRCDQMPRVRRFERKNPPTFNQLQQACMQNCLMRVRTHVINVSRTEHCERHRAIGTGFQQCCRKIDAHFHRSTFVRIGSERRPRAGRAGKAHGRCSEIERTSELGAPSHCGRVLRCL